MASIWFRGALAGPAKQTQSCTLIDGNRAGDVDHLYELPQTLVKRWFKTGRYGRMGTIGDGSCFFHSVCYALNYKGYCKKVFKHRQKIATGLRCSIGKKLTPEAFEAIKKTLVSPTTKTYDQVKTMLCEPKTWAEEIMIKWTSKVLGCNIVFMNLGNNVNSMYCGVHDKSTEDALKHCMEPKVPTVVVAWIDHQHFELVVRIDSVEAGDVKVRKAFDPKDAADIETISNVMRAYFKTCKI